MVPRILLMVVGLTGCSFVDSTATLLQDRGTPSTSIDVAGRFDRQPPPDAAVFRDRGATVDQNAPDGASADRGRLDMTRPAADLLVQDRGRCPTVCINGCSGGVCELDCSKGCVCPTGYRCQIDCVQGGCSLGINCNGADSCIISCKKGSCNFPIDCRRGGCSVLCQDGSCNDRITCGGSGCTLTCLDRSCNGTLACGGGRCNIDCFFASCRGVVDCSGSCACSVSCSLTSCSGDILCITGCNKTWGAGCNTTSRSRCDKC